MKEKNPRVLICVVTYDNKDYCFDRFLKQINNFTYDNFSVLFCDNSVNSAYYNKLNNLKQENIIAARVNPNGKTAAQTITESYEACRNYAIRVGFDYILTLESDIFVPFNDTIERLLQSKKSVVSAIYPIGYGKESYFLLQKNIAEAGGEVIVHDLKNGSDIMFIDGTVKEIFSCGLGCTLIRRDIFSRIPFRYVPGLNYFCDTFFYIDLFQSGIKNFCDTSLICKHENQKWSNEQALMKR